MYKNISFYLIRHGETEWNKLQLFQGASDSPLTELGINQAKLAGKALDHINFNAAYTSYQKRAIDTAKLIIANKNIPLFLHEGLIEINVGKWEGQYIPDYEDDPDFINFENDANRYSTIKNCGEHFATALERAKNAIQDVIKVHQTGNILVVSHGTLLRQLIYVLNGGDWQQHLECTEKLGNTSISILNYQQKREHLEGKFNLSVLNNLEHLTGLTCDTY